MSSKLVLFETVVCVCVCNLEKDVGCPSLSFCLTPLKLGLSLNLKLMFQFSTQDLLISSPNCWGHHDHVLLLCGSQGVQLGPVLAKQAALVTESAPTRSDGFPLGLFIHMSSRVYLTHGPSLPSMSPDPFFWSPSSPSSVHKNFIIFSFSLPSSVPILEPFFIHLHLKDTLRKQLFLFGLTRQGWWN